LEDGAIMKMIFHLFLKLFNFYEFHP